ncbi:inactive pancreatic lipase-related protein 1 [Dermatophagoides farinae]|uniref:inactive pancreatic lipase-related protein 1 n=1 Tax=Dermatophagoides farinae TaxID=6954 RepID=UPI003F5F7C97
MYKSFICISSVIFIISITYIECNGQNKDEVCYGEFGCFKKAQLSNDIQTANVFGHYPDSPENIDTKFHVFSCRDRYNPTILPYNVTERDLHNINYDPKKRTIFIIHGYVDYYTQFKWMGDLKDLILRAQPCSLNVIAVDWRGGSIHVNYLQSSSNTRLVGAIIAKFIEKMNNVYNTNNDHYTIMGHSLGGQISGFAGKRLRNPKVRLILGLDPAGPAFNDVSEDGRLVPNDAKLVVSIHTNGGKNLLDGLGTLTPSGHYNFFPNGGETQPGCDSVSGIAAPLTKGVYEGGQETVACSHLFVTYKLMKYDELKDDDFESMGYRCKNYEAFEAGRCGTCRDGSDDCKPFGRWFDWWQKQKLSKEWREPIIYYIDTQKDQPLSYFFYQIKLRTGNSFPTFDGRLSMNITGSLRNDFSENILMDRKFEPNKEYTYLHKSKKSLGRIESVDATLTNKVLPNVVAVSIDKAITAIPGINSGLSSSTNSRIIVEEIQFNYMNGYTESKRRSLSSVLKSRNGPVEITGKDITHFTGSRSSNSRNQTNHK